jgi:hypothetical protein
MLPVQQNSAELVYRAEVAELADARGSGPRTRKGVGVRVPSSAPIVYNQQLSKILQDHKINLQDQDLFSITYPAQNHLFREVETPIHPR